jgi:hypothetical protein
MAQLEEKLRRIVDALAGKAWRDTRRDQEGAFLVQPSDLTPGETPASMHETLTALYAHARRWAPGLDVPFFVPPVRIDVVDAAGNFVVDEESYASIGVSARFVGDAAAVRLILAHEACHHILRQSDLERRDDTSLNEITTDLAMFVCGFGELVLGGHTHVRRYGGGGQRVHLGYLSPDAYRAAHDHVLSTRAAQGLPARAPRPASSAEEPAASGDPAADGTIELWCGEAMCKRSFRTTLRHEGTPWPVQCPTCGVFLYPAEILERAPPSELQPQKAELRVRKGGRLVDCSAAALAKLASDARPAAPRRTAPAAQATGATDGAAMLAAMLEDASAPPAVRPVPSGRRPVRSKAILAVVILVALGVVMAWIMSSR